MFWEKFQMEMKGWRGGRIVGLTLYLQTMDGFSWADTTRNWTFMLWLKWLFFPHFPFIPLAVTPQKVQGMFQRVKCAAALFIYPFIFFSAYKSFPITNPNKKVLSVHFILCISGYSYVSKPVPNKEKKVHKNKQHWLLLSEIKITISQKIFWRIQSFLSASVFIYQWKTSENKKKLCVTCSGKNFNVFWKYLRFL